MKKKKELFLEEAILDDLAQDLDVLEMPLSLRAFRLVGLSVVIIISIVMLKILYLGIWQGDFYEIRAQVNTNQIITLRAERGIIFDRFNKPMVKNLPSFQLNLMVVELLKNQEEREEILKIISDTIDMPVSKIEELVKEINLKRQNSITLANNLTIKQATKLKNLNFKAIKIEKNFKRQYYDSKANAHLLGHIGIVNKNDLSENPEFSLNDTVGRAGLESYYDKKLRGQDGKRVNFRNAKGKIIHKQFVAEPTIGNNLHLTIDLEFQRYFHQRLKQGLEDSGSQSGVGIAINPQNGEILALISLPSFDANEDLGVFLTGDNNPFFNRAISGFYAPASTIKPLVAFAALKEKIITSTEEIYSPGYLEIPNPYHPEQPSRFMDWKPHGWVNLYSALARSSNVYFYIIGGGLSNNEFNGLGITKLREYWKKFGFGEKTGIDLPAESAGFLPSPEKKKQQSGGIWRLGDTYNISIGQGGLLVTPLQLLNYTAAIANNGKIFRPFVVNKIISDDGIVIKENQPQVLKNYFEFSAYIEKIQTGMIDTVRKYYGTAFSLNNLPISVAAKTGTAQIQGSEKINALFIGYLPAEALIKAGASLDKQIAILVLVENVYKYNLNAIPIANDIFKWYYENRLNK